MKNKSFTLIELLVVIVIIGILAGVIIVSVSSSINKANFAKAQAFSNTVQQELLLNLVSEWTFDEGNAEDSWGNNDGTVNGATYKNKASGNCVYGGCYSFDGTDDYIDCGNSNVFNITDEMSISLWVKINTTATSTDRKIVVKDFWHSPYSIWFRESSNLIYFITGTDMDHRNDSSYTLSRDIWYHIVGTAKSGSFIRLYINGENKVNNSAAHLIREDGHNLKIGGSSIDTKFVGLIDDIRIYNAALTTAQIKQNYIVGLNSLLANNNISKEEYNERIKNIGSKL